MGRVSRVIFSVMEIETVSTTLMKHRLDAIDAQLSVSSREMHDVKDNLIVEIDLKRRWIFE